MASTIKELKRQNKDYKIKNENLKIKLELAKEEHKAELERLKEEIKDKDKLISMFRNDAEILEQKLEKARDIQSKTFQARVDAAVEKRIEREVIHAAANVLLELNKAHVEIARLKGVINKDSSNSSKPPSTNGFKKIPNSREKSTRLRGGQPGHPGHRLALPENIDELVEKGIVKRNLIDLTTNGTNEYKSRYVMDVEVITTVTEIRFDKDAVLPPHLYNEVSYGENIRAMTVLLLKEGIIAEKRLADEIIGGLTRGAVTISPATIEAFAKQFAQNLEKNGELDTIINDLLNGKNMHVDDSPLRSTETIEYLENEEIAMREAKNSSYSITVRTHSNEKSTLYTVNPRKDQEGVERDNILPRYLGNIIQDHESKFYNYGTGHGTCGDHLCRNLKGLRDLENIPWADHMRKHMLKMNKHKKKDLSEGKNKCNPETLETFERKYDSLIEQGRTLHSQMIEGELGYTEFRAMLNRLTKHKDSYLFFMRDYEIPFTNALAERDLRMEKVRQKISYLFRSWKSAKTHTKIRSFISTVKKRKGDLFLAITKVNKGVKVLE